VLGTTEIWRFINDSGVSRPMHMHLVFFRILDRDGFTKGAGGEIIPDGTPQSPSLEESGWKDTAMVGPNEILRVIALRGLRGPVRLPLPHPRARGPRDDAVVPHGARAFSLARAGLRRTGAAVAGPAPRATVIAEDNPRTGAAEADRAPSPAPR
jgi:hypothetical protein